MRRAVHGRELHCCEQPAHLLCVREALHLHAQVHHLLQQARHLALVLRPQALKRPIVLLLVVIAGLLAWAAGLRGLVALCSARQQQSEHATRTDSACSSYPARPHAFSRQVDVLTADAVLPPLAPCEAGPRLAAVAPAPVRGPWSLLRCDTWCCCLIAVLLLPRSVRRCRSSARGWRDWRAGRRARIHARASEHPCSAKQCCQAAKQC